jgi:hypothetical protein
MSGSDNGDGAAATTTYPRTPHMMTGESAVIPDADDAPTLVIRPRTAEVAGHEFRQLDTTEAVENTDAMRQAIQAGRAVLVGTGDGDGDGSNGNGSSGEDESSSETESESEADAEGDTEPADDFTDLSRVGDATADKLHEAGYESFDDLRAASEEDLDDVESVSSSLAESIKDQLSESEE